MNVVFYNGFSEPEEIDITDTEFTTNYLGDITDIILEAFNEVIEMFTQTQLEQEQPLADNGIWINPTLEQLQQFNESVLLSPDDYLENYIE